MAIYIPPSPNPDTSAPASAAASGQTTFLECARTLYRRKATVCWIAGFGLIAAALLSLAQPRMYRSQASVQIQGVNENFLNLRDIYPTAAPSAENAIYVQTQAEMLQQDALLEQVAGQTPPGRERGAAPKESADRAFARQQHHPDCGRGARAAAGGRYRQHAGAEFHRPEH